MKPEAIEESYPLSPMQQGILFHAIYAPQSRLYHRQEAWTLHEDLNAAAFRQAWLRLVERHPILRTSFRWKDLPAPRQDVHRHVTLPWEAQDWRGFSVTEQDERLAAWLAADKKRGFQLDQAPLLRLALFRTGESDYRFTWIFHHLLLDGGSRQALTQEVFARYEAIRRGDDRPQARARSFGGYVEWLRRQDLAPAETYWRRVLAGVAAPTALNVDRAPATGTGEDDHGLQEIRLSPASTAALVASARANVLTPNTLLMGAWAVLLCRYSGDEDVVFGVTRAVRRTAPHEAGGVAGLFINTLPMRVRVPARTSTLAMLKEIRAQWIDARRHEHTPLVKVQEWSAIPADRPLFDSLLLFENSGFGSAMRAQGGTWEQREFRASGANPFPLTVTGFLDAELSLELSYDRRRFDDDTITRMLGHLRTVLEALVAEPDRCLGDLPLLTAAERQHLLGDGRDNRRDYPTDRCLHELVEQQAERTPDALAVVFEGEQLTYAELDRRANQLARYLRKLGVGPETRVGLHLERSLEMVVAVLGVLKAGGAYVPFHPGTPRERVAFLLQDAGIAVALTQRRLAERLPGARLRIVCLDTDWAAVAAQSPSILPRDATAENLAYVIHTSGSTGRPRGVLIEHRQILNYVQGIAERYRLAPGASYAMVQPLSVDSSQTVLFPALVSGGCLHVISEERASDAQALGDYFRRFPIDLLKIAPSHLAALQRSPHPERLLPRRWLVIGGEASRWEWMQTLQAMTSCAIFNHYGPTEATVGALTFPVPRARDRQATATVPIGRPLPNVVARVLDRHGQPAPVGIPGELHLGGDCLARGYLNRPELTAEKFISDPFSDAPGARLYRTGDRARRRPDGNIEFLGRDDDQLKIRGFRVEPREIESALNRHPGVRDCVVVARDDATQSSRLAAYFVAKPQSSIAAGELRDFLHRHLPDYMVPSFFVGLDALPRTPHGKLDRRALPAPDDAGGECGTAAVDPRNPVEKALVALWAELLQTERVGVHDNFFDLGGHSLLAMQVLSRVRTVFRVEIPLRRLFEMPTVAQLAEAIRHAGDRGADSVPNEITPAAVPSRRTRSAGGFQDVD